MFEQWIFSDMLHVDSPTISQSYKVENTLNSEILGHRNDTWLGTGLSMVD